jgi:hypothetical protein
MEPSAASTIDDIIRAARAHSWIPVFSLFVAVIVRVSKTDYAVRWFPLHVPPRGRPWLAVGLGVLVAVAAKLSGASWGETIMGALTVGPGAMAAHDLIVESLRRGRDIGIKKLPPQPSMFGDPTP